MAAMAVAQETLDQLRTAGLTDVDPEIADLLGQELERQRRQIELIASENFTWPAVFEAVGSTPTNKYAEGYPGKRYYGGCEVVDEIEQLAIDRAKSLFGAEHANVQPHAGAQTNMAVYMAALKPGDTILSLELSHGGHLTHGLKVNFSGRLYTIVHYGVSRETNMVDYDDVLQLAKEHRPNLIVRRVGVPTNGRNRPVPEDRRRGRRTAPLRHGPLRRARRRRAPSEPGRALRLRHLDDAQDSRGAPRRVRPLPRGARAGRRPRGLPGDAGRAAPAHDRGEGDLLPDRSHRGVQGLPAAGSRERGHALGHTDEGRPRRPHRRHRHAPPPARPARDGLDRQGRGGAARRRQADREPQHRAVRRAAADRRVGSQDRHAGGDHARLRRGRFRRGRRGHRRGAGRGRRRRCPRGSKRRLCDKHPLYPGFRGFTTYVA